MDFNISEFQSLIISYLDNPESDNETKNNTKNNIITMLGCNTSPNKFNFVTKIHKLALIVQHPDFNDRRWVSFRDIKFISWHSDGHSIIIFVDQFHIVFGQLFFSHSNERDALRKAFELYGFDCNTKDKKMELPSGYSCLVWTHISFDKEGMNKITNSLLI